MLTNVKRRGFTLIELLVVIAIIAILAAILFPVFARARAKAYQTQCLSNIKNTATAMMIYLSDYKGYYPYHRYTDKLWPEYISDLAAFQCSESHCYDPTDKWCYRYAPFNMNYMSNYRDRLLAWPAHPENPTGVEPYGGLTFAANCKWPDVGSAYKYWVANETWVEAPAQTVLLCETQYYKGVTSQHRSWDNKMNCTGLDDARGNGNGFFSFRHSDGMNIAWCDGHADWVKRGSGLQNCDPDTTWWDLGPNTKELREIALGAPPGGGYCP